MSSAAPTHGHDVSFISRREQPWLYASNRKLRNVISISLRNLSLTATPTTGGPRRHRGQTIDDDALPHTLTSPAKIVALREQQHTKSLEHSRSSTDLRSVREEDSALETEGNNGGNAHHLANGTKPSTPPRPSITRMRRRSTLEWANATPQKRQERLERLTAERMADVFFSCHVDGVQEPICVSETVPRTMNPTFRHIDLDAACGPAFTRLEALTVKVWVKSDRMEHWRLLLQMSVEFQGLQFLSPSLDRIDRPLPQNAVLFHLTDGIYTSSSSPFDHQIPKESSTPTRTTTSRTLPTSSFDALLRLSKLDDSIQDAMATRNKIAADLEELLQSHKQALSERDQVAEAADRLKTIEYAKMTVEKQLEKARKQQAEKRASLETRRRLMAEDLQNRKADPDQIQDSRPTELLSLREEREIKRRAIDNQRRRICEDLQKCYPILPIPKHSLAFTIRDLPLPNSEELDNIPPEEAAAALGHVALVVDLLSFYLRQPIPYPLRPRGSSSTIEDPLSIIKTTSSSKTNYRPLKVEDPSYPLFTKGTPRFRFDYAVFLLNKNIQILLESAYRVRVVDIRHTLPNLKYLLYVATAGATGELPARKAGGVRGLLSRTGSDGSSSLDGEPLGPLNAAKRVGSDDAGSFDSGGFASFRGRVGKGSAAAVANGRPTSAVDSLKRNFAAAGGKGR